jgi:hypothetical protein
MSRPIIHIAVAAALAATSAHVVTRVSMPERPMVSHFHLSPLKHVWPALEGDQREQIKTALPDLKGTRVEIYCDGAPCSDLARDLDRLLEDVGAESAVVRSWAPLGHGFGISPDDARGRALATAIKNASNGALDPQVLPMDMAAACGLPHTFEQFQTDEPVPGQPGIMRASKPEWRRVPDEAKFTPEHRACLGRIVIAIGEPPRS